MDLKTFKNGVHPSYHKELTATHEIEQAPMPKKVIVPLQQHIGAPCKVLVAKGDIVEEGQRIGEASSFVSAHVHAPVSGKIKDVDIYPFPGGGNALSVVITADGETKDWINGNTDIPIEDLDNANPEKLREIIRESGIVGMGGAAFPTVVKLSVPTEKKIHTVVLNGCECEPFLTTDHRLMVERPEEVLWGLKVIMKTVGATEAIIGIEDNKIDAIDILREKAKEILPNLVVVPLETKYPQGAEKMLIKATMNKVVPIGKLPLDIGVVVNNIATSLAIYEAVQYGKPLIERVLTVSGNGVKEPKNINARIGTSFKDLIDFCGGIEENDKEKEVLHGGPMMGLAQTNLAVPIVKGTSGITILNEAVVKPSEYNACIKCAACVEVCPMSLMPYRIGDLGRLAMNSEFTSWHGMTCIECGCCSFVCPSKRPLVEWIRVGKHLIREEVKNKDN